MKIQKISETINIIHVNFDTQEELAETFCRFQEYYESPEFKGKIFTLGQYREWYSQFYGAWTYYTDWSGFNIPDWVLEPFKEGKFDPLSEKEQKLVDMFRHRAGKFYIIGTFGDNKAALDHEICHALYYLDEGYNERVTNLIASASVDKTDLSSKRVWKDLEYFLLERGYAGEMLRVEIYREGNYLRDNIIGSGFWGVTEIIDGWGVEIHTKVS